jgi:hypothetical protein
LRECRVREIEEHLDNYGSIEFDPDHSLRIPLERLVVEAMSQDRDQTPVEFIVHGRGRAVTELEVLKLDGSPLVERPHPETLTVSECHFSETE